MKKGCGIFVILVLVVIVAFVGIAGMSASQEADRQAELRAQSNATDWATVNTPEYEDLFRYAERYDGDPVEYSGKVVQTMNDCYRIAVDEDYDKIIYFCGESTVRVLEDDIVIVRGFASGIQSYKSVMGATIEIPKIEGVYIRTVS